MKTAVLIMSIVTGVLLFSTCVCGLWIRYSGEAIDDSSINFHMVIGIVTAIVAVITMALAVLKG